MSTLVLSRKRTSVWGFVVAVAAIATGFAVYSYLSWIRAQVPVAGRFTTVVVAARDIESGTTITSAMLRADRQPARYVPASALSDMRLAVGLTTSSTIFEGEPITRKRLSSHSGLSAAVPKGLRAYSLSITSGTTLNFVPKAGDRVDVIVTYPREVLGEPRSITVLRAVPVASVGRTQLSESGSGKVTSRLGLGSGASQLGVTLFVTPQEAERLAMAESLGRITVVLAPIAPDDQPAPAPIGPKDVGTS
jgi:pilus assembly protein CpaB